MTHVHHRDRAGLPPDVSSGQKARLYCPRCGHGSPVDGDWVLTVRPDTIDLSCPDCRELLTTRPVDTRDGAKERSTRDW